MLLEVRTVRVKDAELWTQNCFSAHQSAGTHGLAMAIFFLLWLGFFIASLLGFFGAYLPRPNPDISWQQELWSMWQESRYALRRSRVISLISGLTFYVFYRLAKKMYDAAKSPHGWLLRATPDGVYVKYRSHLRDAKDTDEGGVLFVPRSQIQKIDGEIRMGWSLRLDTQSRHQHRIQGEKKSWLRISLNDDVDFDFIKHALSAERQRDRPKLSDGSRSVSIRGGILHFPVTFRENNTLFLNWEHVKPNLHKSLRNLEMWFPTSTIASSQEESIHSMSTEMIMAKVSELLSERDEPQARRLLRSQMGLDDAQAKSVLEEFHKSGELPVLKANLQSDQ